MNAYDAQETSYGKQGAIGCYDRINGLSYTSEDKLSFITGYIRLINKEVAYKPATKEFILNFDSKSSIRLIRQYTASDIFFRTMIQNNPYFKNFDNMYDDDIFFLLMELKVYLTQRRNVISQNISDESLQLIRQYKVHSSFNHYAARQMEANYIASKYSRPMFFVPETMLYSCNRNSLSAGEAIQCLDHVLFHMKKAESCSIDMEIYSFFVNFRNMLFNSANDAMSKSASIRACNYIVSLVPAGCKIPDIENEPSVFTVFVECLYNYKNALPHMR